MHAKERIDGGDYVMRKLAFLLVLSVVMALSLGIPAAMAGAGGATPGGEAGAIAAASQVLPQFGDPVVSGIARDDGGTVITGVLVVAEDGQAKRTPLSEYPTQGRYGQGVVTARFAAPGVGLAGAGVVQSGDPVVLVTSKGAAKTVRARSAPRMGRPAQGRTIIALRKGDRVCDVLCPVPRPEM